MPTKEFEIFTELPIGTVFIFTNGHVRKYKKVTSHFAVDLEYMSSSIIDPHARCIILDEDVQVDVTVKPMTYGDLKMREYFTLGDGSIYSKQCFGALSTDFKVIQIGSKTEITPVHIASITSKTTGETKHEC